MEQQTKNSITEESTLTTFKYFPFFNHKQPVFVLILIGVIFYCTSLYNEYALDDGIVIHQNNYVLRGASGIGDIMTKDLYDAFYKRMNAKDQLQGGRYHPLPIVSFALEQELIGTYRTGYYEFTDDINNNGKLDDYHILSFADETENPKSQNSLQTKGSHKSPNNSDGPNALNSYEYNTFTDLNKDQIAQANECNNCWDTNKNFCNDPYEDLNSDGVFNEVDCQVRGAFLRHFNNMWLYILAVVLLYLLFRKYFFRDQQDLAFLAALLFLAHPLHSEVIANIKGRDEIFSAIFMTLTFLFSFKFMRNKKTNTLILASLMFLLALLSKEYAIMLLLLVPLAMHVFNKIKINITKVALIFVTYLIVFAVMIGIKIYLASTLPSIVIILSGFVLFFILSATVFKKEFINKDLNALMLGLFGFSLLYMGLRLNAVSIAAGVPDTEILNDPYLFATGEERFATKIFILLKYLILAFFPKNLTSDYSYASIAYRHYADLGFILSLILNTALLIVGIALAVKRHIIGFAIITYFAFLLLVTNFIFAIGTSMHEGFLFHASIGIVIAFAWLILKGFDKIPNLSFITRRGLMLGCLTVVIFLYGCKTWERNWDWKNDITLFLKDVKTSPNSVLVLGNAGARWIDLADSKEITGILLPGGSKTFNNYNGTLVITDKEMKERGFKSKKEAALRKGIAYLKRAVELHPSYVNGYLNLGLANFKLDNDKDAIYYWKLAEHFYPENPYLKNYYRVYSNILKERGMVAFEDKRFDDAVIAFKFWALVQPKNYEPLYNLGGVYFKSHRYELAKKSWDKALLLNPDDPEILNAIESLTHETKTE